MAYLKKEVREKSKQISFAVKLTQADKPRGLRRCLCCSSEEQFSDWAEYPNRYVHSIVVVGAANRGKTPA